MESGYKNKCIEYNQLQEQYFKLLEQNKNLKRGL